MGPLHSLARNLDATRVTTSGYPDRRGKMPRRVLAVLAAPIPRDDQMWVL